MSDTADIALSGDATVTEILREISPKAASAGMDNRDLVNDLNRDLRKPAPRRTWQKIDPRVIEITLPAIERICAGIRAGAFAWVASESAGIPWNTAVAWLDGTGPLHNMFRVELQCATADARLRAEARVYAADPKMWLTRGPGRQGFLGRDGWSAKTEIELTGKGGGPVQLSAVRQTLDLSRLSLEELETYERLIEKATVTEGSAS